MPWVVLLLHPWDFLPVPQMLWMSKTRRLSARGVDGMLVHTRPTDPTHPYLLDEQGQSLTAGHIVKTLRAKNDDVSLFAMIANAYSKVQDAVTC